MNIYVLPVRQTETFMKMAIVGSRNLTVDNLGRYLPDNVDEIISGGAKGIDTCAREYANSNNIKLTEITPEYSKYGRSAPLKRNLLIIEKADEVYLFLDEKSNSTKHVINECRKRQNNLTLIELF